MTVPREAPFVVENSKSRFVIQTAVAVVFVIAGIALLFTFLVAGLTLVVAGAFFLVLSVMSLRNTGSPLLAADEHGLVIQAFPGPAGERRLAWSEIERLYMHRPARQFRLLCILPRDVAAELAKFPDSRQRSTIEGSIKACGAPYSVNLVAANISDRQAGQVLHPLAAGRTQVDLPAS